MIIIYFYPNSKYSVHDDSKNNVIYGNLQSVSHKTVHLLLLTLIGCWSSMHCMHSCLNTQVSESQNMITINATYTVNVYHESCHVCFLELVSCKHMKPKVIQARGTSKNYCYKVSQRVAKVRIRLI